MSIDITFTKQNLEIYLRELAKELKKRGRGIEFEIIIVGGASVIMNYGFRAASFDIDALYEPHSVFKESIRAVADKYGLPDDWVNDDFRKSSSFSYKIIQYSEFYKRFFNVLTIRTIRAEYLVAMKLVSGRMYKKDLSDVAGIVLEQKIAGNPLDYELIDKAIINLYGDWSSVSDYSKELLDKILKCENLASLFIELSENEISAREVLSGIVEKYPNAVSRDNVDEVIAAALKRKEKDEK